MDSHDVARRVGDEIAGQRSRSNDHGLDLKACLVKPRIARCRNSFALGGRPGPKHFQLWIVLEEEPGSTDGYLILFDESSERFGLGCWSEDGEPIFLHFHGGFWDALEAM